MLYLISLGLWNIKDMSLRALEILRKCDIIYLESYTSNVGFNKDEIEEMIGKKITFKGREFIEGKMNEIVDYAKKKEVCICSPGDILSATTHVYFMKLCKDKGVKVKVIHGSSIFTAIAKTGLSLYKFGRVISLPHPNNFPIYPTTPFERIKSNISCGLHSLLLLDIGFRVYNAVDLLKNTICCEEIVACYSLGGEKEEIIYGNYDKIKKYSKEWDDKAQCIVIPSHDIEFYEREILNIWRV